MDKKYELDNSKLRVIRKKAGIKAKDLAELFSKTPSAFSNYETDVANPPADVLLTYLILCDASPLELTK